MQDMKRTGQETMKKLKVAYLRGNYLGRFETDYLKELPGEFDVTALTSRYNRYGLDRSPIAVRRLPSVEDVYRYLPKALIRYPRFLLAKLIGLDGLIFGLRQALAGYDLVHTAESLFYFSYQAARLKSSLGFRLIVLQDEVIPFQRDHSPLVRRMRHVVHEAADAFIARTQRAKDALILEGVALEKIRVIGHGVDPSIFTPRPKDAQWLQRFGLDAKEPIVLFMGKLVWEKGVDPLIHAAALLSHDLAMGDVRPKFLIVGEGHERRRLMRLAQRLGLRSSVSFVSDLPYDAVPTVMNLADLFVLPSISTRQVSEQFGHVLIEAMACGKPVVSTWCGAIPEVVADAGVLVQPNDPHELAGALKRLLLDADARAALAERGRRRVQQYFSATQIASQIAALYREVLASDAATAVSGAAAVRSTERKVTRVHVQPPSLKRRAEISSAPSQGPAAINPWEDAKKSCASAGFRPTEVMGGTTSVNLWGST